MRRFIILILVVYTPLFSFCQLVDNYDTCRTQLSYQYLGNSAKETHIDKARSVQDNGIVSAGYLKQAGNKDALIIKQNSSGQVIWQKEYGNTDYDEQFTDWRELTDRQLLVGGIAKNRITLQSFFFMMVLTSDGNVVWQKSYADIAASSNITNARVWPDHLGQYFFAAETDSSIIYGMATNTGVNWQKTFNTNPGTKLVAAFDFYQELLIATNTVDSGYHVSNLYYINYYWTGNPTQIKYTTKLGGAHQSAHYILHDFELNGQYMYFSGIRSVNNNPYEVIRVNMNQGFIHEALETIVTPSVAIDSASRTAINIYCNTISFTAARKNDRLNAIEMTGSYDYTTYVVRSYSYHLPDSIVLKGNIKTWDFGCTYFGFKELIGGNKQIIQLKTDSAAISPTCVDRQLENFTVIRDQFPDDTVRYTYNVQHALMVYNYNASVNNSIIDTLTICRELKCPILPLSDSCLDSYQKIYKAYEQYGGFRGMVIVNGRTFATGAIRPMDYMPERSSPFIAEINRNGQVTHQKKYVFGIGSDVSNISKGMDSTLIFCGITEDSAYYPSVYLSKIDTNLNLIWVKSLRVTTTPQYAGGLSVPQVKQANDGSYFLLYCYGEIFDDMRIFLTKLDVNGNYLWSKIYRITDPGYINITRATRLEVSGGNVYIVAGNAYNSYSAGFLIKATENDGTLLWCKKYSNAADYLSLGNIMYMYNNELIIGGNFQEGAGTDFQNILVKADPDGNILNTVSLKNLATNTAPLMNYMHYGANLYMCSGAYTALNLGNPYQINVIVNNNFNILSSKKRSSGFNSEGSSLAIGGNGQLYELGAMTSTYYNYDDLPYIIKFSPNGSVGTCPSDTMLLQPVAAPPITVTNVPCAPSDSFFTMRIPVYRTEQFFLATSKLVCASVPGCNSLNITGDTTICDQSLQYTFHAVRNSGCSAPLQWLYQSLNIHVLSETDTTITIQFTASGSLLLKARFTSNCTEYKDSLLIHILGAPPLLELGTDTSLCPGASLMLNAHTGFLSYTWQNGSNDSTFMVTTAGLYYVTVTDSCNNMLTDSIHVMINGNAIPLNLGPDSNFCNTNSIVLNAHAGFSSYLWQNGSTDSIFTATIPGLYYVTVTDSCGNNFRDSVKIRSYRRANSLNLGADTVFCNSGTMQMNAGAGFETYLWQNGSTDSIFIATIPGLYYVQVKDSCGSLYSDSLTIGADIPITFDIGPDTAICKTDSVLLQVTPGLTNYTWWPQVNTISQGPSAITAFPNLNTWYHVSAIKANGCLVTDSILVSIHIPPLINLGADTSICAGDTLHLNAGSGFVNYTWSTGEFSPSISVYQAALYNVTGIDINHCKSSDSITIIQVIALPVIQLPSEAAICQGQPMILHAGNGFSSYLWNTGLTTESITVTSLGQYWVTVTNSSGCTKKDSISINNELPLPADFIKDASNTICSFETITISSSQNYASYLWSNGSTAGSITINNAGDYWLQVTDANGCIGRDSFSLATKDCNIGVYFPNGFTPNNDGQNDNYKPKAYGRLVFYNINIYNRYGELIFDSRNITEGWNGKFKGMDQDSGSYVWKCSYQLTGEKMQNKSGYLLLIR